MSMKKQTYVSPRIEVIQMENEGVIAASGFSGGGGISDMDIVPLNNSRSGGRYNAASSSEIEDMINDLFTVEQ